MKYCAVLSAILIMLVAACSWNQSPKQSPNIARDTLLYHDTTLIKRAADCVNKPDSACTIVKIAYPLFKDQPALNDTIRHRAITLFGVFEYSKSYPTFNELATRFLNAHRQDMEFRKLDMVYTLDTKVRVVRQDSALVAMRMGGYSFQGGAHGSHLTIFMNWDTKAKKMLSLKDILIDNYKPVLDSVGEQFFRKQGNLTPTQSLKDNYFFTKDKFTLNDNFLITPAGLNFLYNEYEIKPYAAGQTELFIPYKQIQKLLRVNTVVSQYHP